MMQERPQIIEAKKKHVFRANGDTKKVRNLYFELEQMRLNSEHDRIVSYREMVEALITNATAKKIDPMVSMVGLLLSQKK